MATDTGSAEDAAKWEVVHLQQNWSKEDRAAFYWTSQGSALISYDIYMALTDATTKEPLNSVKTASAYGLLLAEFDPVNNPDGLPIGVARTAVGSGPYAGTYMGLTCAACHTGELRHAGKTIRIDGGKTNSFDMLAWVKGLSASLDATLERPEEFTALLKRMKDRGHSDEADVRTRLKADAERVRTYLDGAIAVPHSPGAGRMDAIGGIQNVFLSVAPAIPENRRVAVAPVKAPFLWNTGQSAWVQWSGIAANPFSRNFGQALAVFTRFDTSAAALNALGYRSTTDTKGLIRLEELSIKLAPPKWPEELLGTLDPQQVARGAGLFDARCSSCHNSYPYRWTAPRQEGKRMLANGLIPLATLGVDPVHLDSMTFSAEEWVETKHLKFLFGGRERVSANEFFGVLQAKFVDTALDEAKLSLEKRLRATGYLGDDPESRKEAPVRSLKAPPIDGLWTSAPYLHNGSVPNLFELLSPASERSQRFYVGTEFDPVKLGFDTTGRSGGRLHDASLQGNSSTGHSFENGSGSGIIGPYLTPEERYDLIEFLKSQPDTADRATPYGGPENPKLADEDPTFFNTRNRY